MGTTHVVDNMVSMMITLSVCCMYFNGSVNPLKLVSTLCVQCPLRDILISIPLVELLLFHFIHSFVNSSIYVTTQKSSGEPPVGLILLERCQVEKNPNEARPFCFSLRELHMFPLQCPYVALCYIIQAFPWC